MPSQKAVRADDKRLKEPGKKQKKVQASDKRKAEAKKPHRYKQWEAGELKASDFTDEEIKRGRLMDNNGGWRGGPRLVAVKLTREMNEERQRRWSKLFEDSVDESVQTLKNLAAGIKTGKVASDTQFRSAVYLLERAIGKVPDKAEVAVKVAKWEEDIAGLLIGDDDEDEG